MRARCIAPLRLVMFCRDAIYGVRFFVGIDRVLGCPWILLLSVGFFSVGANCVRPWVFGVVARICVVVRIRGRAWKPAPTAKESPAY